MRKKSVLEWILLSSLAGCISNETFEKGLEARIISKNFHLPRGVRASEPKYNKDEILSMLKPELIKYPIKFINDNLDNLIVVRKDSLYLDDMKIGGLVDEKYPRQIILADDLLSHQDTGFHHEFSSILLRKNLDKFPWKKWKDLLPPGFKYEYRKDKSVEFMWDFYLNEQGFVCEYGKTDIEEDINTIAHSLLSRTEQMNTLRKLFPRIEKKVKIIIEFYNQLEGNNFMNKYITN